MIKAIISSLILLMSIMPASASKRVVLKECSSKKKKEVLEKSTLVKHSVTLNCSLNLKSTDVVTKRIRILGPQSSGLRLKCNGAKLKPLKNKHERLNRIEVKSTSAGRPEDVYINGCEIYGSTRIYGAYGVANANGILDNDTGRLKKSFSKGTKSFYDSSHMKGHTTRVQKLAPYWVTLTNNKFYSGDMKALYVAGGASKVIVLNSTFESYASGKSGIIYLGAETSRNVIKGNIFKYGTAKREAISIDGSSHNLISENTFHDTARGGIFIYRNCGEGGTVRHLAPRYNKIVNNTFKAKKGRTRTNPAIFIGSRNYNQSRYCHLDNGYPFGSSIANRDIAEKNHIIDNIFVDEQVSIRNDDRLNVIKNNSRELVQCYIERNRKGRWVVRDSAKNGLHYSSSKSSAEKALEQLESKGACAKANKPIPKPINVTKPTSVTKYKCYIEEKKTGSKWVIRYAPNKGLFYSNSRSEVNSKLVKLQKEGVCQK